MCLTVFLHNLCPSLLWSTSFVWHPHFIHCIKTNRKSYLTSQIQPLAICCNYWHFCWIPSHTGIKGNSCADQEAKLAVTSTVKPLPIPASDFKPYIIQYISLEWQKLWNSFPNNKLHQSHPTINSISPLPSSFSRKDQTVTNRLMIGHSRLTHLHLITKESPPLCSSCSCLLSIEHILCHCQAYQSIRRKYFSYTSLSDIFSKTPKKQLLKFLTEIDIYNKL